MIARSSYRFDAEALTGRTRRHIVQSDEPRFAAAPDAMAAFLALRKAAAADGFDLRPFSAFRDLKTQAKIWNRKWRGERPTFDRTGAPIDLAALPDDRKVWSILNWSAAPGASRHHWGSEIDVVDGAVVDTGHTVDLLPYETAPGGPFHALSVWLDANVARFGFYRPYDLDRGGMCAEPWHLSHAPTAAAALEAFTIDMLRDAIGGLSLDGSETLLALLPEIFARHILAVAEPGAALDRG